MQRPDRRMNVCGTMLLAAALLAASVAAWPVCPGGNDDPSGAALAAALFSDIAGGDGLPVTLSDDQGSPRFQIARGRPFPTVIPAADQAPLAAIPDALSPRCCILTEDVSGSSLVALHCRLTI